MGKFTFPKVYNTYFLAIISTIVCMHYPPTLDDNVDM